MAGKPIYAALQAVQRELKAPKVSAERKHDIIFCKECGKEMSVRHDYVKKHTGVCVSCQKTGNKQAVRHGDYKTRLYHIWIGLKHRRYEKKKPKVLFSDYEEFKSYIKDLWGGLKYYRSNLRDYVKLVQDFDKLCDEIREYVNELSITNYELDELNKLVDKFNCYYKADLEYLEIDKLVVDDSGKVYIGEINKLRCMNKAFIDLSDRSEYGLELVTDKNNYAYYKRS
jgi:hypothetical protein